ncbi:hypothetical protein NE237_004760 [Protea cynaroides]|uniref:Uncharacterized protein n=1 Tax=Protea cynaroides TaxID=273540 RepID=A0A9Q0KK38_9MAGN|nr:hypothetical protein NE237_004760 [Protea cynaroides]
MAASSTSSAAKSLFQSLRRFFKKPWEITGPCASPEYKSALHSPLEYRAFCPATVPQKAIIPTSDPETVYDIKYYSRDQRRNRPPIRRTILKKADRQGRGLSEIGLGVWWLSPKKKKECGGKIQWPNGVSYLFGEDKAIPWTSLGCCSLQNVFRLRKQQCGGKLLSLFPSYFPHFSGLSHTL